MRQRRYQLLLLLALVLSAGGGWLVYQVNLKHRAVMWPTPTPEHLANLKQDIRQDFGQPLPISKLLFIDIDAQLTISEMDMDQLPTRDAARIPRRMEAYRNDGSLGIGFQFDRRAYRFVKRSNRVFMATSNTLSRADAGLARNLNRILASTP